MTDTSTMDADEARAHQLQELIASLGVPCVTHWDRSPWGVRIWLTDDDGPERETPSVYVLTELTESKYRPGCYEWLVCLDGFDEDTDAELQNLQITITEFGDNDEDRLAYVMRTVLAFVAVLRAQVA